MKRGWGSILVLLALGLLSYTESFALDSCSSLLSPPAASTNLNIKVEREQASVTAQVKGPVKIRLMAYNALDFNVSQQTIDRHKSGNRPKKNKKFQVKSLEAIQAQANIIKETQPDVITLEEVHGEDALKFFSTNFLDNQYEVFFQRGNDSRGFEIGFLVRRDLLQNFDIEFRSHKDIKFLDPISSSEIPVFSRDAPSLLVKPKGSNEVSFVVIGVHSKSKRDRRGDPESFSLRSQQAKTIRSIVEGFQHEFGADTPIIVNGDFNTGVHKSEETIELLQIMTDVFDLLARPPPDEERVTHTYHPSGGRTDYQQLDAILVTTSDRLEIETAQVYRYKDENGRELALPKSYKERQRQPSDHFPVIADLIIN